MPRSIVSASTPRSVWSFKVWSGLRLGWPLVTSESSRVRSMTCEEERRKGETIVLSQLHTQKPRIFNPKLPSWKHCSLRNCPLLTMTTIPQLHLGSLKRSTVADKSWLEHSADGRSPSHECAHQEACKLQGKHTLPKHQGATRFKNKFYKAPFLSGIQTHPHRSYRLGNAYTLLAADQPLLDLETRHTPNLELSRKQC